MSKEILSVRVRPLVKSKLEIIAMKRGKNISQATDEVLDELLSDMDI